MHIVSYLTIMLWFLVKLQMCKAPDVSLRLRFTTISSRSSLFCIAEEKEDFFLFLLKVMLSFRKCLRYFSFSHIGILTSEGRNTVGFLQWSNCSSTLFSMMCCFLQNWGAKLTRLLWPDILISTANSRVFILQSVSISCFILLGTELNRTWFSWRSWCLKGGQE